MKKNLTPVFLALIVFTFITVLSFGIAAPDSKASSGPAQEDTSPAEAAPPTSAELAQGILDGMTLEEKVWQMLFVFPQDVTGDEICTDLEVWADSMHIYPAGGFVIGSSNMQSPDQLKAMLSSIKSACDTGAFIGIDEEGGQVARLSYTLGVTTDFKAMFTYKDLGEEAAYSNAYTIAGDLRSFGFNVDFAPVADVWTNEQNTVIGKRAYSNDPIEAKKLVASAVKGFIDGGVIATLKHFPGHGDTAEDSHYASAYSDKTLEELKKCEFLPFVSGIEAGAGMVMVGHITLTQIDPDNPATLSKIVLSDILRGELGYDGVIITDSFAMGAIAENYDECQAAVQSINAGCDIILGPANSKAVAEAIASNVSESRINESVLRILQLKIDNGIITF